MYIVYNEYDLLELFGNDPVYIGEKEAGICFYSCKDRLGLNLTLSLSIYENECDISLDFNNKVIFHFNLKDVSSFNLNNKTLHINRIDNDRTLIIGFSPNFTLNIENI